MRIRGYFKVQRKGKRSWASCLLALIKGDYRPRDALNEREWNEKDNGSWTTHNQDRTRSLCNKAKRRWTQTERSWATLNRPWMKMWIWHSRVSKVIHLRMRHWKMRVWG